MAESALFSAWKPSLELIIFENKKTVSSNADSDKINVDQLWNSGGKSW